MVNFKYITLKSYKPRNHGENKMSHEGDVSRARKRFLNNKDSNLHYLLKKRFNWMNDFIKEDEIGIEVGCGTGISKHFIKSKNYKISDYANHEWLDYKMIDALKTGFKDQSFDYIISSNMIHHVPYPTNFFKEASRILRPGGRVIIQEINCSLIMRKLLRAMRHEGYDFTIDVFDDKLICTDPEDLWSANCAIPNLLFDDKSKFERKIPDFKVIYSSHSEFLNFINSGGVISKTINIPLPKFVLKTLKIIDDTLTKLFPNIFALQRQIVLIKNE